MVYRGHVENGVIRLEDGPTLREGIEVEVRFPFIIYSNRSSPV